MRVLLIDADNLNASAWIDEAMQKLESEGESFAVRRAYGSADSLNSLSITLRKWVIRPFTNLPLSKNTTDMSLAVDAMELACQTPRPSTIVIGSGDADFVPLVVRLRERGIKVVCVSEQGKMAGEAEPAYDQVIFVGAKQSTGPAARKTPAKAPAPKAAPAKAAAKKLVAKKVAAKKAAKEKVPASSEVVYIEKILSAVPALKAGEWQLLNDVAKLLHDEKLLGKNTASPKLFKKFESHFELEPAKQPNRVRYVALRR